MTITDILTPSEIKRAIKLYQNAKAGTFAKLAKAELIEPNLERIETKLGQKMDAGYLAYAVEYILMKGAA